MQINVKWVAGSGDEEQNKAEVREKVWGEAEEKNGAEKQRCEPRRKVHLEIFLYVDSFVS